MDKNENSEPEKSRSDTTGVNIDATLYAELKVEQKKRKDRYPHPKDALSEAMSDWISKIRNEDHSETEDKKADAAEPKGFQYWESTDEYFQAYDNFRRLCFDLKYRAEFMIRYEKKFGHAARIHSEKVMDEYALNHPEYREAYDGKRNTQDKEHNVPSDRG